MPRYGRRSKCQRSTHRATATGPLPTPEDRIHIPPGGNGFVVKLKTAPAAALTLDGVMVFEEVG